MTVHRAGEDTRPVVPLSPLQRAALLHERRTLQWTVEAPLAVEELLGRVRAVLPTVVPLTYSLVDVAGLRLPRQQQQDLRIGTAGEGWEVVAGATTLRAERGAHGEGTAVLTVLTDPVFADATTLELLLHRLAGATPDAEVPDFLSVAAGHHAMHEDGELADELGFWDAQRRRRPAPDDLVAALATDAGRDDLHGDEPRSAVATLPGTPADDLDPGLAHLAMAVLVERLAPHSGGPARLVDVRPLMGLEGVAGPLSQVLPDDLEVDPGTAAGELLARQRARHEEQYQWAGGPALRADDALPLLVLDPRPGPTPPPGWQLLRRVHALSGVVVLHTDPGAGLVAGTYDALPTGDLQVLVDAWSHLVEQLADPNVRPGSVGLLARPAPAERAADPASEDDLCRLVHELALADGDAPALRRGARVVTRRQLLTSVGGLLERLDGVGPGSVVGLLAPAGPELVTGALAALWRGAAFLPLDPSEPALRLSQALATAGARHVVVPAGAPVPDLPPGCAVVVASSDGGADPGPPVEADPDATAYVLRTSGSTGRPKSVPVRRSSLDNHLRWACESLVDDDDVLPVVSSPVFDASLKQLLGPLRAGRVVHLLEADRVDVEQVHAELAAGPGPLVLNCVPSYWAELLRVSETGGALPLRRLLLGGEAVSPALLERTLALYPGTQVLNLYGPTEATVTTTAGVLVAGEPVHVGRAVAGATVTVVDRAGHPLPPGLRGEVWIQGPGVSTGYLDADPADPSPFVSADLDGTTRPAYRSGDLAIVDDRGRLRLLGRADDQVKLRGWRIELGEIEQVAETCAGVDRAVAVLVGDDEPRLRLFTTGSASGAEVRGWLADRLPEAMVPGAVAPVGRLPLTTTGKVDRQELVRMVPERDEVDPAAYSEAERLVAAAWREVLGGPWPHADDEFFAVGGHSLLLARLVNRLRAQGCTSLSLRQVVRRPTVASIAAHVADADGGPDRLAQP